MKCVDAAIRHRYRNIFACRLSSTGCNAEIDQVDLISDRMQFLLCPTLRTEVRVTGKISKYATTSTVDSSEITNAPSRLNPNSNATRNGARLPRPLTRKDRPTLDL